jgi:hypothetical protein
VFLPNEKARDRFFGFFTANTLKQTFLGQVIGLVYQATLPERHKAITECGKESESSPKHKPLLSRYKAFLMSISGLNSAHGLILLLYLPQLLLILTTKPRRFPAPRSELRLICGNLNLQSLWKMTGMLLRSK